MTASDYALVTVSDRPDLADYRLGRLVWPAFILEDPVSSAKWGHLGTFFPEFQFVMLEAVSGRPVGLANSVPLPWSEPFEELPAEGWDWALASAVAAHEAGRRPNVLCGLQVAVDPAHQGKGISYLAVGAMRAAAAERGFGALFVPVRPTKKSLYPLISMESYIRWQGADGLPFDPWLRAHVRLGGRAVRVCDRSMHVTGSVTDWERWTGMHFPGTGSYVVPGALVPVAIDLEHDEGVYVEPNVWMVHDVG